MGVIRQRVSSQLNAGLIERWLTPEKLQQPLDAFLNSLETSFQSQERLKAFYRYGEEALPAMIQQVVEGGLNRLETSERPQMEAKLAEKLTWVLQRASLEYHQAEFSVDMLFNTLLTPASLREILLDGLTDENIQQLERTLSNQIGGVKGFLLRLMGLGEGLRSFRQFLEADPEASEQQLTDIMDQFELRERLAERMSAFQFAELPEETQTVIVQYVARNTANWLQDNRLEISDVAFAWTREASRLMMNRILQWNARPWLDSVRPKWRQSLAVFVHGRLTEMVKAQNGKANSLLESMMNAWLQPVFFRFSLASGAFGFTLGLIANGIQLLGWGPIG